MIDFGKFQLYVLNDGHFKLDGGAMFGVVPKLLWQKTNPPNADNRILLGLNCWLIRSPNDLIVVDTGVGTLYDDKFRNIFEIERESGGLLAQLAVHGFSAADVTKVVLTHLHFDHCGGNCTRSEDGRIVPTFPNATYYFQNGEFDYARKPDARSKASYLPHNWQAVEAARVLHLISGDAEIIPGVSVQITGGHTRDHQIVKVASGGETACFLADLVPTDSHLKTPYVMAYDLYPATTMKVKEEVLQRALAEKWLLFFEHAPSVEAGYLAEHDGRLKLDEVKV